MRLFEHAEFDQMLLAAAAYFGERRLRPAIIEKDYYVTEALRSIVNWIATRASTAENLKGDAVIFKGGTSLSKGWNLIQRFSEDIDIFLDPLSFEPPLGKNAINRELKNIRDAVSAHPALTLQKTESKTTGGLGRNDVFTYHQRFGAVGEIANRVRVESGAASGREPTATAEISSYLAQFLKNQGVCLQADDEAPFTMCLLHFRRTFVEKMFAIHSKVELFKRDGVPLGSYARHYYDIFQLAAQQEVIDMLKSSEYATIKDDYDQVSRAHFPRSYSCPDGMTFATSDALFPPENLVSVIAPAYTEQCGILYYGSYPPWEEVQSRLAELRDLL